MSDDRNTPPGVAPTWHRIDVLERDVARNQDRIAAVRVQQIEGFGQDGRGGVVGRLCADYKEGRAMINNLAEIIQSMRRDAAADRARLMIMMGVASATGAGVVGAIFKVIG